MDPIIQLRPASVGCGGRDRDGTPDAGTRWVWRNMLFRNLGDTLSSTLIREATDLTYRLWLERYGEIPPVPLRTEIDVRKVRSRNPGYCYLCAGYTRGETKRGKLFLYAPPY